MTSHWVNVLLALATTAAAADTEVASFSYPQMQVGQRFEIQTADRVYRGELLDRGTGQCQISQSSDGTRFGAPRTIYLLGATAGPQDGQMLVLMRDVKVGLKMELGVGDLESKNRQVTSEVKAIRLD